MDKNGIEFNFLLDDAVDDVRKDRLKHQSIAETIEKIVVRCPLPFTIGLFGKWGTGKSSISKLLKKKLNEEDNSIAFVEFDVWKYEDDSLRRFFLKNLVESLKEQEFLPKKYSLDERLDHSTSRSFEGALKISWKRIVQLKMYILLLVGSIIVGGIITYFLSPTLLQAYITSVFSLGMTTSAILFLFQIGSQIFTTETITLSQDRLKDAYEFEKEFSKVIDSTKASRVLIIIDNLDRCAHSKAVEVLSTIKTFLEPKSKKCIFLVQCDEEAIKKHLISVYNKKDLINEEDEDEKKSNNFDADEFLRKFFNTSVKIPPFIGADLEEYTKELLTETKVEAFQKNSDLVSVITQAFRDNPRQIKQFINTLLSHYLVALARESGKDPVINTTGIVTGNPAFLAKFLIIRQKWPSFYKSILENPKNIVEYNRNNATLSSFMGGTNIVKTDNIRAFIYLKQSSRRLALPGGASESLEIALEDNKSDEAIEIIKEIRTNGATDIVISEFISEIIQDNKDSNQNLINIINIVARCYKDAGLELQTTFCERIAEVIRDNLLNQIYGLDLNLVFFVIRSSRIALRSPIVAQYVNILGQAKDAEVSKKIPDYPEYVNELAGFVTNNKDLFSSRKPELTKALTEAQFDNLDVLNTLAKNDEVINDFISPDLLMKLVESISDSDSTTSYNNGKSVFSAKFDFLSSSKKTGWTVVVEAILNKFTSLVDALNKTPETPEKITALNEIINEAENVLERFASQIKDVSKADEFTRALLQSHANAANPTNKSLFIPVLFYLSSIVSDSRKNAIETIIQSAMKDSDISVVESIFDSKTDNFQKDFFLSCKTTLEERAIQNKSFLDFIWEYEDTNDKDDILARIIESTNYLDALRKLDEINYKVNDPKRIVNQLLTKALALPKPEKPAIYDVVNKMDCGKDKNLRDIYINQLKDLTIGQDVASQEIAYNAYNEARSFLPHLIILPFVVSIIDWLISLDPINANHKFALKIAISYWDKISDTHKDNLLTIIFDRIIAKTTVTEEIDMAFDIIYSAKLSYSKNKPHFDIILGRAESEQNTTVKDAIKTGLLKLKPSQAKATNSFWNRVDKL